MTTAIPANVVKDLRELTGAGMMDCKRALAECNGDMEAAKDWLRKRGQAIAEKKSARKASEGLIFHHLTADGKTAVMLELNCETDFVARNTGFTKLGQDLLQHISEGGAGTTNNNTDEYLASPGPGGVLVSEIIRQNVATLGENIGIGRFIRKAAADSGSYFQTYIHPPGKLGVLIEVKVGKEATKASEEFQTYCRDLAMHVAAAAPECLDRKSVPQEKLDRELEIYRDQARNEGKPENLLDKIAQGKLGKFYTQVCLLEQEFVKNPDENIQKLTDRIGKSLGDTITVVAFERMKVGG